MKTKYKMTYVGDRDETIIRRVDHEPIGTVEREKLVQHLQLKEYIVAGGTDSSIYVSGPLFGYKEKPTFSL